MFSPFIDYPMGVESVGVPEEISEFFGFHHPSSDWVCLNVKMDPHFRFDASNQRSLWAFIGYFARAVKGAIEAHSKTAVSYSHEVRKLGCSISVTHLLVNVVTHEAERVNLD